MYFTIGFIVGVLIGLTVFVISKCKRPKTSGAFVMDFTDPLKDVCRLELAEDLNSIYTKQYITLQVVKPKSQD